MKDPTIVEVTFGLPAADGTLQVTFRAKSPDAQHGYGEELSFSSLLEMQRFWRELQEWQQKIEAAVQAPGA